MRARRAILLGGAAGVVATLSAHVVYWYLPRERAARPSAAARARLAEPGWEISLWMPFPHQNLGALEDRVGDLRHWLALVVPAGGLAADRLPTFGPWPLPPARELAIAQRGDALVVELAVYPAVALLARASGHLARNPWLAGGEVELGSRRRARVEWSEGRWRLVAAGSGAPAGSGEAADEEAPRDEDPSAGEPVLARFRLGRPLGRIPAGLYRIERGTECLELRSGAPPEPPAPALGRSAPLPAAWLVERPAASGVSAAIVWSDEGAMPPFPMTVTLERGRAGRRRRLPGEELLRLAGGEPQRARTADFVVRALGVDEIERGRPVAAELAELLDASPALRLYGGLRPDELALAARRLQNRLGALPLGRLFGDSPERLTALLAPLRGCPVSVLEIRSEPRAVRWRLCLAERPPGAAPAGADR